MLSEKLGYFRGIVNAAGELALVFEQKGDLQSASAAIDSAIAANTRIPDELWLLPRNLAIKADIETRMGQARKGDDLYRKSITLVNRMIQHTPTTNIQRELLTEMSDVYSGYFGSLCAQRRYNEALQILENVRGRVENEAIQHHEFEAIHEPTPEEKKLTQLNLSLINTDDPSARDSLSSAIYNTELFMTPSRIVKESVTNPTSLPDLQKALGPHALLVEYVLAEPTSYVLASRSRHSNIDALGIGRSTDQQIDDPLLRRASYTRPQG